MDSTPKREQSPHRTWKSGSWEPVHAPPLRVSQQRREEAEALTRLKRERLDPRLPHALRRG